MFAKVSFVFIMINKPNVDQALIQIRRLEKVQHIDSAQRSQTDGLSHGRTCRYSLVFSTSTLLLGHFFPKLNWLKHLWKMADLKMLGINSILFYKNESKFIHINLLQFTIKLQ